MQSSVQGIQLVLHSTYSTDWLTNVSSVGVAVFSYAYCLSTTVSNLSGVVKTVNNLLTDINTTTGIMSTDILQTNLSTTNVLGKCKSFENTTTCTTIPP